MPHLYPTDIELQRVNLQLNTLQLVSLGTFQVKSSGSQEVIHFPAPELGLDSQHEKPLWLKSCHPHRSLHQRDKRIIITQKKPNTKQVLLIKEKVSHKFKRDGGTLT